MDGAPVPRQPVAGQTTRNPQEAQGLPVLVVVVENREGYRLTKEGHALLDALQPLHTWAARWGERA